MILSEPWMLAIIVAAGAVIGLIIGRRLGFHSGYRFFEKNVLPRRLDSSRASLKGQISEHLVPYLPGFEFRPSECKFLGKPVDFIVFRGLDAGEVEEVVFLEVKTGKSAETGVERSISRAVERGRVSYSLYRLPK
ncbi:MAG: Holliday junction resolvase-like protein [Candidatus Altiarchaeota archaeon]